MSGPCAVGNLAATSHDGNPGSDSPSQEYPELFFVSDLAASRRDGNQHENIPSQEYLERLGGESTQR